MSLPVSLDVRKRFRDFSLDFRADWPLDGIAVLFGRSGSGKTSILNAVAGLLRPDAGHIRLGGEVLFSRQEGRAPAVDRPPERRQLGYVFQEARLFPHLTVAGNLRYAERHARDRRGVVLPVEEVTELLGLGPLLSRHPALLSGGEKQRLAIGRALLSRPRILLMDEPMAGLDGARRARLLPYIHRLQRRTGIPLLYVTHALDETMQLADHLLLVDQGRLCASGTPEELSTRLDLWPMLGRFEAGARLAAVLEQHDPAWGLATFRLDGDARIQAIATREAAPGTPFRLRIRARDVLLSRTGMQESGARNHLRAVVTGVRREGVHCTVRLRLGSQALLAGITARTLEEMAITPGETLWCIIKAVAVEAISPASSVPGPERDGKGDGKGDGGAVPVPVPAPAKGASRKVENPGQCAAPSRPLVGHSPAGQEVVLANRNILAEIGAIVLGFLATVGNVTLFAASGLLCSLTPPFHFRLLWQQLLFIGYFSLPVVGLTALFTGMVLALQIYIGSSRLNAESTVANIVVVAITRELGPVLGGLMVAGRVAAAIAAEIGTMRVTEQIDALVTLSTSPFRYLVAPRLVAAAVSLPLLVLAGDAIGVMGGFLVATSKLGFQPADYLQTTRDFLEAGDVISGLVKAFVFGFVIALMGCWHGFHSRGGAQGVGRATTGAVVSSSVLILMCNYLVTEAFFSGQESAG